MAAPTAHRQFPARVSDGLGLCVKYGGSHQVVVEGRRLVYPGDSVSVRTPGCVWASEPGVHGFVSIDVAPELLPDDVRGQPMSFLRRRTIPDVAATARRLLDADDPFAAEEILTRFLGGVFSTGRLASDAIERETAAPHEVLDACEFLREHLASRPTLEDAAAAAGVSRFALVRRFRTALGTTPHAYLVLLRVNRAQRLLATGSSPADAALQAGFSDQAHLGLWFRRVLGVTPAAYRRQVRFSAAITS